MTQTSNRSDIYTRITDKIVADLEQGVRPWLRPWNAEHTEGRITRPLRHNGIPYNGINVVMLWSAAVIKGYRLMAQGAEGRQALYLLRREPRAAGHRLSTQLATA